MPRMDILDKNSLNQFQRPPEFTKSQRENYFIFSKSLMEFVAKLRSPSNQIGFFLNWVYFKISKRFYVTEYFNVPDIAYIEKYLGYNEKDFKPSEYALRTRQEHQTRIIKLYRREESRQKIHKIRSYFQLNSSS